jgi:hypothetical protein
MSTAAAEPQSRGSGSFRAVSFVGRPWADDLVNERRNLVRSMRIPAESGEAGGDAAQPTISVVEQVQG